MVQLAEPNTVLLCCLAILRDECPPTRYQLCGHGEDGDGEACVACWERYCFDVANGCVKQLPYRLDFCREVI